MKHPKHPGVYAIRHIESARAYIGSAKNIYNRWRGHKSDLRYGNHHSPHLQNAWNKYGEAAFVFEVLEVCLPDVTALRHREEAWFAKLEGRLFNAAKHADAAYAKPCSPEHKEMMSKRMKGNKNGEGTHYCGILTESDVAKILHLYASGKSTGDLADEFQVTRINICRIVSRKIWWRVVVPKEVDEACRSRVGNKGEEKSGERCGNAKLDWGKVAEIRRRRAGGETYQSIADAFGVTLACARHVVVGIAWKNPPKEYVVFEPPPEPAMQVGPSPLLKTKRVRPKRRPDSKPRPARVAVRCETCGKEIFVPPCIAKERQNNYCSKPCRLDGLSRHTIERMKDPAAREHLAAMNRGKKRSPETIAKRAETKRLNRAMRAGENESPALFSVG